jgi:hypothetical protein
MIGVINFLIHIPINVTGYVLDYLKRHLRELEKAADDKITLISTGHEHGSSWLREGMGENSLPDIMLAHASDFSVLEGGQAQDLFSRIAGGYAAEHPLRDELKIFHDPEGFFYPLFIVPMVMIYNRKLVNKEALHNSWSDLLADKWKVAFPDKDTPISKAVMAYLKKNHAREYAAFKTRVVFKHSPVDVVQAVAREQFHFGIANMAFSQMAAQRNVEVNWPLEGPVLIPQVLVWKKEANPLLTIIADVLTRPDIQQYLGKQSFWPVADSAPLHGIPLGDVWNCTWSSWQAFLKSIQELEHSGKISHVTADLRRK